jgi:hypothetical protein
MLGFTGSFVKWGVKRKSNGIVFKRNFNFWFIKFQFKFQWKRFFCVVFLISGFDTNCIQMCCIRFIKILGIVYTVMQYALLTTN